MCKKVYCNNCKFLGTLKHEGSAEMLPAILGYVCLNKNNDVSISTYFERRSRQARCEEVNSENDCKYWELSKNA